MNSSIRQLVDAIPDCNLLIKSYRGTVIYNGPYDKLPERLLDKIPHSYLYAPMEKTIKIRMNKSGDIYLGDLEELKPWTRTILKDVRGNVLYDGFHEETPEELLNMMVIDRFTDPATFTTIVIIDR